MRHERKRYHQRDDCKIDQGACACAPAISLIAKEVYRRSQSERMDENRTYDCGYANHQWKQDRELMILRHLSTVNPGSQIHCDLYLDQTSNSSRPHNKPIRVAPAKEQSMKGDKKAIEHYRTPQLSAAPRGHRGEPVLA